MTPSPARTDRWKALDFGPPLPDAEEPDLPVLVEYIQDKRVAVITMNRPHADNAITTAMGARLTEILDEVRGPPPVRAVILTGAGQRAFSVGSDLRQRKEHDERGLAGAAPGLRPDPLHRAPAAEADLHRRRRNAYGGGCELAQSTDFIIASDNATFGQPEAMLGLAAGGGRRRCSRACSRRERPCRC